MSQISSLFKVNGIVAINKPVGISSAGALRFLKQLWFPQIGYEHISMDYFQYIDKKFYEQKSSNKINKVRGLPWKVGHGGTLSYTAVSALGYFSDTMDIEGKITQKAPYQQISIEEILSVFSKYEGDSMQTPPM
ncbi:putative tRNA pseudouridine synthase 1 [Smittium mucronatum]|uniref:tRNA pseudouridine(55) synthase n=1 Tax=Smittium mucronatum TaxID=133383 RepID=A0A1R0GTJ7_9FUNG|nr:putative tRNA pseudouridine synthase 1 [Smittium mucronatum]